jgi:hypothetical protein
MSANVLVSNYGILTPVFALAKKRKPGHHPTWLEDRLWWPNWDICWSTMPFPNCPHLFVVYNESLVSCFLNCHCLEAAPTAFAFPVRSFVPVHCLL